MTLVETPCESNHSSVSTNPTPVSEKSTDAPPLEAKILEAMGKRIETEKKRGPAIHADIVVRWDDILNKGIPKDDKKNLIEKYPTP